MAENSMLAQVHSLPALVREIMPVYDRAIRDVLDHNLCLSAKRLFLTGCGDSHDATLASEFAFESIGGIPTEPQTALQFARYGVECLPEGGPGMNLVVGISVSGEVSRTLEAIRRARRAGATTLGLTATPGSRIAEAGDRTLLTQTPPFEFAPGVRSYIATLLMLYSAAVRLGEVRGRLTPIQANDTRQELEALANAVECTIALCDESTRQLASDWADANEFVFAGDGPNYGTALYSAAKILEASGDTAIGQDLEEWAHLQYFGKAAKTPTLFVTNAERSASRAAEVAVAAKAIGRRVATIVPEGESEISHGVDAVLRYAKTREAFSPVVACIPGMLFAAHRSDVVGEPFFRAFGGGRDVSGGGGISRIRTSELLE